MNVSVLSLLSELHRCDMSDLQFIANAVLKKTNEQKIVEEERKKKLCRSWRIEITVHAYTQTL